MKIMGWRKMVAWGLIFLLIVGATWFQKDVPTNAERLLTFATGFFFGANALGKLASAKGSKEPS